MREGGARGRVTAALALLALASSAAGADPAGADPLGADPPGAPATTTAPPAAGAPNLAHPLRFLSAFTLQTDGGLTLRLPPGRYLREDSWTILDAEVRRLQDRATDLAARNASLEQTLGGWSPGWWTLAAVTATALGGGWYLRGKI